MFVIRKNVDGFTLVEMMIAMVISTIIAMVVYFAYSSQQKIYIRQEANVDMQQNLRAGLYLISQEVRMAAYDSTGKAGASIINASEKTLQFTQDITDSSGTANYGDGLLDGPNENVTISFSGVNNQITRATGGGVPQSILDNVDFLEFVYTLDDGTVTLNPPASGYSRIRTVQISILVRSPVSEAKFYNQLAYVTPYGTRIGGGPFNDNFRRRFLYTTVQCRNINL